MMLSETHPLHVFADVPASKKQDGALAANNSTFITQRANDRIGADRGPQSRHGTRHVGFRTPPNVTILAALG